MSFFFSSPFQVHIVAGQSNAHGNYGNASHYPADEREIDQHIPFFYEAPTYGSSAGEWVTMGPQEGMFGTRHFGPEVAFARALYCAGEHPAIFKFTMPASSLCQDWKTPGEGGLYDALCQAWTFAMRSFPKALGKFRVASLIWIQGESDAETETMALQYQARLRALLAHLRRFVGNPRLPTVLGVHEEHPWVLEQPEVVMAQKEIAQAHSSVVFCSMIDLQKQADSHLTPTGLVQHGERLFDAYRSARRTKLFGLFQPGFLQRLTVRRAS